MLFARDFPLTQRHHPDAQGPRPENRVRRAHLQVLGVRVRERGPDLLHHGRHQVVGLKVFGVKLFATLRAADGPLRPPPVAGDADTAEVVHARQHDGLPEEVAADGAGQVFSEAASGGGSGGGHGDEHSPGALEGDGAKAKKGEQTKLSKYTMSVALARHCHVICSLFPRESPRSLRHIYVHRHTGCGRFCLSAQTEADEGGVGDQLTHHRTCG